MSVQTSSKTSQQRRAAIRRSALWAAWGDALGFMTERANAARVRQRTGQDRVEQTKPWQRKIGGRTGPTVTLPAGCISDDTQLRLSTSRAIRGDGNFDVEPFAKIELATWPAYALGAGIGSTAAANNLKRRDATWDTNFFDTKRSNYMQCGGNGAAMRIQPHVWSATSSGVHDADVLVNAVVTHGHPRGILGALFYAGCLDTTMRSGSVPPPGQWAKIADETGARLVELAHDDHRLAEVWLGAWEDHSEHAFGEATSRTVGELEDALKLCAVPTEDEKTVYARAVEALDARGDERGSAIKSAVLALLAAHLFQGRPEEALICCVNELWTDTDTIATMAGALLGVMASDEPEGDIADRDVIAAEADRMAAIAEGQTVPSFPYPSLVTWGSPKAQLDSVVVDGDQLHISGLGPAGIVEEVFRDTGKTPSTWEWLRLWFGQQVLIRRRPRPGTLSESHRVQQMTSYLTDTPPPLDPGQLSMGEDAPPLRITRARTALDDLDLHELTEYIIDSGFDERAIGEALSMLARRPGGINDAVGFAAIIAKAIATRQDRERRRSAQS
jgi:ADP-ribosylglycohydrolase